MKRFISYFDLLGFSKVVENNTHPQLEDIMQVIFREIEDSSALGTRTIKGNRLYSDLSKSKLHTLNFSDTIIFWTDDDSEESLIDILEVSHRYNWRGTCYFFPARGALVYGEISATIFTSHENSEFTFSINSIFGMGLIDVHRKAESTQWSGAVIDNSVIERIIDFGEDPELFLKPYAKLYEVPYKDNKSINEYAFKLTKEPSHSAIGFKNTKEGIEKNFADYNKDSNTYSVRKKLENTIEFLKSSYSFGTD